MRAMLIHRLIVAIFASLTVLVFALPAEDRTSGSGNVMVILGNSKYREDQGWKRLGSPKTDATRVSTLLAVEPFNFTALPDAPDFFEDTNRFWGIISKLKSYSDNHEVTNLVFYYAGHGVDIAPGVDVAENAYLVPTNASNPPKPEELVSVEKILSALDEIPAKNILVILDACAAGLAVKPWQPEDASSQPADASRKSRVLVTAATKDNKAFDGDLGLSPITVFLVQGLEDKECDVDVIGKCTSADIAEYLHSKLLHQTGWRQIPSFSHFGHDTGGTMVFTLSGTEAEQLSEAEKTGDTKGRAEALRRFLEQFPADQVRGDIYARAARVSLNEIESESLRNGSLVTADVAGFPPRKDFDLPRGVQVLNSNDMLRYSWIPPDDSHEDGGFWIGETEVTVRAFRDFRGPHGILPRAPGFNPNWKDLTQPIVNVPWQEAKDYCAYAAGKAGNLPTQRQWGFAARGGAPEGALFPFERQTQSREEAVRTLKALRTATANFAGAWDTERAGEPGPTRPPFLSPLPVGSFSVDRSDRSSSIDASLPADSIDHHCPHDYGLCDVVGNVAEWTFDEGVARGGSFADTWRKANLIDFSKVQPIGDNRVGFRCAIKPRAFMATDNK
jgi:Sulfatase-modifying factor enzyme 1/Caspase domain